MSGKNRFRWYPFLLFALLCVASLLSGGVIGARLGAGAIMDNWLTSQSNYALSHLLILRQMRNGDDEAALNRLEAQLDRDIVSLLPDYYGDARVSERARARAAAVLEQARDYRDEYPRPAQGRAIDRDVQRALGRDEPDTNVIE